MNRPLVTALAFALVVAAGCGDDHRAPPNWPGTGETATAPAGEAGSAPAASDPIAAGCGHAGAKTGVLSEHVRAGGKQRHYTLVVPPGYAAQRSYPLIIVLHGHGGSGAQARASFDLESVAGGAGLFLYPDGIGGGWDLDSPAAKNGDVAFFDAMLDTVEKSHCVDLRRVFVAGFSNGAYMANQLACRRGDRIRAIASHSGGGPYENAGSYDDQGQLLCPGRPVASLVVHGLADGTVMPSEGQKSVDHWTHANHCGGSSPNGACATYQGCAHTVTACKVPGLGHALWPKAKAMTWSFFESQK